MPASEVSICNIAIAWLGGNRITSLDSDSAESQLCSAVYEEDRDAVLELRDWTFAIKRAELRKLEEQPVFGYEAAFQLPPDLLRIISLATDPFFNSTLTSWEREGDKVVLNRGAAYVKYVSRCKDPSRFSPGFIQCLAARIATDICVGLTNNPELALAYSNRFQELIETGGNMDGLQGRNTPLFSSKLVLVR